MVVFGLLYHRFPGRAVPAMSSGASAFESLVPGSPW